MAPCRKQRGRKEVSRLSVYLRSCWAASCFLWVEAPSSLPWAQASPYQTLETEQPNARTWQRRSLPWAPWPATQRLSLGLRFEHRGGVKVHLRRYSTSFLSFSSSASFSVSKALVILMDFCKEAFSSSVSFINLDSLKDQRVKNSRNQPRDWSVYNCPRTNTQLTFVNGKKTSTTGKIYRGLRLLCLQNFTWNFTYCEGRKSLLCIDMPESAYHWIHLNLKKQVNNFGRRGIKKQNQTVAPPPKEFF